MLGELLMAFRVAGDASHTSTPQQSWGLNDSISGKCISVTLLVNRKLFTHLTSWSVSIACPFLETKETKASTWTKAKQRLLRTLLPPTWQAHGTRLSTVVRESVEAPHQNWALTFQPPFWRAQGFYCSISPAYMLPNDPSWISQCILKHKLYSDISLFDGHLIMVKGTVCGKETDSNKTRRLDSGGSLLVGLPKVERWRLGHQSKVDHPY